MSVTCVIRGLAFKQTAKRLNIAEDALEQIAFEYINQGEGRSFPSDSYINRQYIGKNTVSEDLYEDAKLVWEHLFSRPITGSMDDVLAVRKDALKYFDENAIRIKPLNDGTYTISVAMPVTVEQQLREVADTKTPIKKEFVNTVIFSQEGTVREDVLDGVDTIDDYSILANILTCERDEVDGTLSSLNKEQYDRIISLAKEQISKQIANGSTVVVSHTQFLDDADTIIYNASEILSLIRSNKESASAEYDTIHKYAQGTDKRVIRLGDNDSFASTVLSNPSFTIETSKSNLEKSNTDNIMTFKESLENGGFSQEDIDLFDIFLSDGPITSASRVLNGIVANDSYYSTLANQLCDLIEKQGDVSVVYINDANADFGGKYSFKNGKHLITINLASDTFKDAPSATLIHEILHCLSSLELKNNPAFRAEIVKIINELKKVMPNDSYALTSPEEFIASIYTDPIVQEAIRTIEDENKPRGLFSRVIDFILKALGLRKTFREKAKSVCDQILYAQSKEYKSLNKDVTIENFIKSQRTFNLTAEQRRVVEGISDDIAMVHKTGAEGYSRMFCIQAKAGCGKTTIVDDIIENLVARENQAFGSFVVVAGAVANQAKKVLTSKISKNSAVTLKPMSVAKMLQAKMDYENGEATFTVNPKEAKNTYNTLRSASLIIVDECSMITEEQLETFNSIIGPNTVVLFLGDKGQLGPIRTPGYIESHHMRGDEISPIFTDDRIKKYHLTQRVRQGEGSPILEYADKFWDYTDNDAKDRLYPTEASERSKVTDEGALIFDQPNINLEQQLLPLFKEAVETQNPNLVKLITYRKKKGVDTSSTEYNRRIHEALFPNAGNDFQVGELVIFRDSFGKIDNSVEGVITKTYPLQKLDLGNRLLYELQQTRKWIFLKDSQKEEIIKMLKEIKPVNSYFVTVKDSDNESHNIPVISRDEENYKTYLQNIAYLRNVFNKNYGRLGATSILHHNILADLDFDYAINAHKGQGSTYDVVAVDNIDIIKTNPEEAELTTKAQCTYTGLTRARNITIVRSFTSNEEVGYQDIKGINDHINAIKSGKKESYTPKTFKMQAAGITEEEAQKTIQNFNPANKQMSNLRKYSSRPKTDDKDDVTTSAEGAKIVSSEITGSGSLRNFRSKLKSTPSTPSASSRVNVEPASEEKGEEPLSPQEKTRREFKARQDAINKMVEFNPKNHTYKINGVLANFSVTEIIWEKIWGIHQEKIKETKHEDGTYYNDKKPHLPFAGAMGNDYDAAYRDFFMGKELKASSYPNLYPEDIPVIKGNAQKLRADLMDLFGEDALFITDESLLRVAGTINIDGKTYTIAGTMDMVVIDRNGKVHVVDFKTHRLGDLSADTPDEKAIADDTTERYALQTAIYAGLQASNAPYAVETSETHIAVTGLKYDITNEVDIPLKYYRKEENSSVYYTAEYVNDNGENEETPVKRIIPVGTYNGVQKLTIDLTDTHSANSNGSRKGVLGIQSIKTPMQNIRHSAEVALQTTPALVQKKVEYTGTIDLFNTDSVLRPKNTGAFTINKHNFLNLQHYLYWVLARYNHNYTTADKILEAKSLYDAYDLFKKITITDANKSKWSKDATSVLTKVLRLIALLNPTFAQVLIASVNSDITAKFSPIAIAYKAVRNELLEQTPLEEVLKIQETTALVVTSANNPTEDDERYFNVGSVDTDKVDLIFLEKTWRNDKTKSNHTVRVYLKGDHAKGYFELVKDLELDYYSVHFKTSRKDGEFNTSTAKNSTKAERKILFLELVKLIPEGAFVSTWGSISPDGEVGLNNVGRNMTLVGVREVESKKTKQKINIPIFLNLPAPYYKGNIINDGNTVFVFGSNTEGRHGAGAALTAKRNFGAVEGQSAGLLGDSYALITKDLLKAPKGSKWYIPTGNLAEVLEWYQQGHTYDEVTLHPINAERTVSPLRIIASIAKMYECARQHPEKTFKVSNYKLGLLNLNGYLGEEMIAMFKLAGPIPSNVMFSLDWWESGMLNDATLDLPLSVPQLQSNEILVVNKPEHGKVTKATFENVDNEHGITIKNADLLNKVLVNVGGHNVFVMGASARRFVVANINGVLIPYYCSAHGTDGKQKGAWYPFFGNTGNWLVKGSINKDGKMSYSKEIDDVTTLLNDSIKLPELSVAGTLLGEKERVDSYNVGGISTYTVDDMFPEEAKKHNTYNSLLAIYGLKRKNGAVLGGKANPTSLGLFMQQDSFFVKLITGIDASNVFNGSKDQEGEGWVTGMTHITEVLKQIEDAKKSSITTPVLSTNNVSWSRTAQNSYEVSSRGDSRFSALNARFKQGTTIFGHDVSGRTIESVYQHGVKQGDWSTDNNSKTGAPKDKTIITGNTEDDSYALGYLPLWLEWAKLNPTLIEDLRTKVGDKTITDLFASTRVSLARALADILNSTPASSQPQLTTQLNTVNQLNTKGAMDEHILVYQGKWNRSSVETDTKTLYIFTDNTDRDSGSSLISADSWYAKKYGAGHHFPTATTAVIRGLNNARPISTVRWFYKNHNGVTHPKYDRNSKALWHDSDVEEFTKVVEEELKDIVEEFNTGNYDTIMFPSGDGLFNAEISDISKTRCPKLYDALCTLLHKYGFDSLIPSDTATQSLSSHNGLKTLPHARVAPSSSSTSPRIRSNAEQVITENQKKATLHPDTGKPIAGKMDMSYGNDRREGVKASTTLLAIVNGERKATTRTSKLGSWEYWSKVEEGNIVEFHNKDTGESVLVKITKAPHKLDASTNRGHWSLLEGWSVSHFIKNILPTIESEDDFAFQMEYEYVLGSYKKGQTVTANPTSEVFEEHFETSLKKATGREAYVNRTVENIDNSDVTIAFAENFETGGEKLTRDVAVKRNKYISVDMSLTPQLAIKSILKQMEKFPNTPLKINIAGNGIYDFATKSLEEVNDYVTKVLKGLKFHVLIAEIRSGGQTGVDLAGIMAALALNVPWLVHAPNNWMYKKRNGVTDHDEPLKFMDRFKKENQKENDPDKVTRADAEENKDTLYIFPDNLDRDSGNLEVSDDSQYAKKYGKGKHYPATTKQSVRGLDNAFPITIAKRNKKSEAYWTDDDYNEFVRQIDDDITAILNAYFKGGYKNVSYVSVLNEAFGRISKERTPLLYEALNTRFYALKDIIKNSRKGTTSILYNYAELDKVSSALTVWNDILFLTPHNDDIVIADNVKEIKSGEPLEPSRRVYLKGKEAEGFVELTKAPVYLDDSKTALGRYAVKVSFNDNTTDETKKELTMAIWQALPINASITILNDPTANDLDILDKMSEFSSALVVDAIDVFSKEAKTLVPVTVLQKTSDIAINPEEALERIHMDLSELESQKALELEDIVGSLPQDHVFELVLDEVDRPSNYLGEYTLNMSDYQFTNREGKTGYLRFNEGSLLTLRSMNYLLGMARQLPISSKITLSSNIFSSSRKKVTLPNYLFTVHKLIEAGFIPAELVGYDIDENDPILKQIGKYKEWLKYDKTNKRLILPYSLTYGLNAKEINENAQSDNLLKSKLFTPSSLRQRAKATMYYLSDMVTKINTIDGGYEFYFRTENEEAWENDHLKDVDFKDMSRIDVIKTIGLDRLLECVKDRMYLIKGTDKRDIRQKKALIRANWMAFVKIGYDTLASLEAIAMKDNVAIDAEQHVIDDDDWDLKTDDEIAEILGSSAEHWQIGFRSLGVFHSLSTMIKTCFDGLHLVDREGNEILDEFGCPERVKPSLVTALILSWVLSSRTIDDMIKELKSRVEEETWIPLLVEKLGWHYDFATKTWSLLDPKDYDLQFLSLFFTNFRKYFQPYTITYKDLSGNILIKVVNQDLYSDTILGDCVGKENSYALGKFKLRDKSGRIIASEMTKLKRVGSTLEKIGSQVNGKRGKLGDLIDKSEYHKAVKEFFTLLDIDLPEDAKLFRVLDSKKQAVTIAGLVKNLLYGVHISNNKKRSYAGIANPTDDPEIWSGAKHITDKKAYKELVKVVASTMGEHMESMTYEAGKTFYSYVMPSYLGDLCINMRGEHFTDEEYEQWMDDEFFKTTWFKKDDEIRCPWLKALMEQDSEGRFTARAKRLRENFVHTASLHYLETPYADKTPALYIASMMKMYFYDTENKKQAYFRVPTLSNKPSEEYIKFERITDNYETKILRGLTLVFSLELDRIFAIRERKQKFDAEKNPLDKRLKKSYDKNAKFLFLDWVQDYVDNIGKELWDENEVRFAELLNKKLRGKALSLEDAEDAELIKLFLLVTAKNINQHFEKAKKTWRDEGFLELNDEGKVITASLLDNLNYSEDELKEYYWNDMFATINILEITCTDVAYYKDTEDLQKRLAELHAPGAKCNKRAKDSKGRPFTDGTHRMITIKDNEVASEIAVNLKAFFDSCILKELKLGHNEEAKKLLEQRDFVLPHFDGSDPRKLINVADAQGYTTPTAYRKKMGIFGKWTDKHEKAYDIIMALHQGKELSKDEKLSDYIDILMLPIKPFTYALILKNGHNGVIDMIKEGRQIKDSEYCLIMSDALLRMGDKPNRLRAIYDFMESTLNDKDADGNLAPNGKGVDTIVFESTSKAVKGAVIDLNSCETEEEVRQALEETVIRDINGNVKSYDPDLIDLIDYDRFTIQLENPAHFRDGSLAHGSLVRILDLADLPKVDPITGEDAFIYIGTGKNRRKEYLEDGRDANGKVEGVKTKYFNAIRANIEMSLNDLATRFGWNMVDPRIRNIRLSRVLLDAIRKDSRFGYDLLWACSVNAHGEFNIPLSDPIQSNRIQQLLNSIIKNTINKQEIAGGPIVQVTNWGMSDELHIRHQDADGNVLLTEEEFNTAKAELKAKGNYKSKYPKGVDDIKDIVYTKEVLENNEIVTKKFVYRNYQHYIENQRGVAYLECYLPIEYANFAKDFMDEDGQVDIEKIKKVNPKLLDLVGYRIPTESKYSMLPMRVKGFLPINAGEGIQLPKEITTMTGSDFDVDKMYMMMHSFIRKVGKDGTVTYENPREGSREANNNYIVDVTYGILTSNMVKQLLFTPGNFEAPKKYGYLISAVKMEALRQQDLLDLDITEGLDIAKDVNGRQVIDVEKIYDRFSKLDTDQLKEKNYVKKNLAFVDTQMQFHKQNMTAGKLIGIFATGNVSHAFVSLCEGAYLMIPKDKGFVLERHSIGVSPRLDIDRQKNFDGDFVSSNLAALLAASVDAVKDPILNLININEQTAGIIVSMLRMGFSLETVSLLCALPAVVKAVTSYQQIVASGEFASFTTSLRQAMLKAAEAMHIENAENEPAENIHTDNRALASNLLGTDITTNYMALQIMYRMASCMNESFRNVTHMTRYNSITSAVGPFASDTHLLRMEDDKFWQDICISDELKEYMGHYTTDESGNISGVVGNPILCAFRECANIAERNILGSNMLLASQVTFDMLEQLRLTLGVNRLKDKVARKFMDFFMSYYVNMYDGSVFPSRKINGVYEDSLSFNTRKYMLTQFPKDFLSLKKKYKDNIFIQSIQYKEDKDKAQYPYLLLGTRGLDDSAKEDLKQAWALLLQGDENDLSLALSIAQYNFFRGSFGFNPKTFMALTPNAVKERLSKYINALNNSPRTLSPERQQHIIQLFMLHNPNLIKGKVRQAITYSRYNALELDTPFGKGYRLYPDEKIVDALNPLKKEGPFVKFKNDIYFRYVPLSLDGNPDIDSTVFIKVDALGGNNNGFEISTDLSIPFPKTIFNELNSEGLKGEGSSITEGMDADKLAVAMETLFTAEQMNEFINDPSFDAITAVNDALSGEFAEQNILRLHDVGITFKTLLSSSKSTDIMVSKTFSILKSKFSEKEAEKIISGAVEDRNNNLCP